MIVFFDAPVIRLVARILLPSTRQVMISAFLELLILFILILYLNAQALSIVRLSVTDNSVLHYFTMYAILLTHGI